MKKLFLLFVALSLVFLSCSKDEKPVLTISQTLISTSSAGNSTSITLIANNPWSVSGTDWCTVSPSSGQGEGEITVTITVKENTTYDARNHTLTFISKELSQSLSVNQESNYGIVLPKNNYELSSDAQQISVEVKANITYDIAIDAVWIKESGTKALTSKSYTFDIDANTSYDSREGVITIKEKNGNNVETIKVKQAQKDAIIISSKEYSLSSEAQSLEVKLQTNVDLEVVIPDDAKSWVSHTETKALSDKIVILGIKANEDYSERNSEIIIKKKSTGIADTIKISQARKEVIVLYQKEFDLSCDAHTIGIKLQTNVKLEIIIPDESKSWVSYVDIEIVDDQKNLEEKIVSISIGKNITNAPRECEIIVKSTTSDIFESVIFNQEAFSAPKDNEIWYTSIDNNIIVPYKSNVFGANIISNKYEKNRGVITFDKSITSIGTQAFRNIKNLKTINLPEGIKTIGTQAFYACTGLVSATLPEGVTSIENQAFWSCHNLIEINIPNTVKSIGEEAISQCYSLISLTLPEGLTSLGNEAFSLCDNLKSINIPNSITTYGNNPFAGCHEVIFTGIHAAENGKALIQNGKLISYSPCVGKGETYMYDLPNNVTSIGGSAFAHSPNMVGVTISDGVTSIGDEAFRNCGFTSITIPKNVTSIGKYAFIYCSELSDIYCLPTTPPSLGQDAFYFNAEGRVVHVPINSVDSYKKVWTRYKSIIVGDLESL